MTICSTDSVHVYAQEHTSIYIYIYIYIYLCEESGDLSLWQRSLIQGRKSRLRLRSAQISGFGRDSSFRCRNIDRPGCHGRGKTSRFRSVSAQDPGQQCQKRPAPFVLTRTRQTRNVHGVCCQRRHCPRHPPPLISRRQAGAKGFSSF